GVGSGWGRFRGLSLRDDDGEPVRRLGAVGVATVALLAVPTSAQAFNPNDPLAPKQWYLTQDHAFDAFSEVPDLPPVRVAVIDSGIDFAHPELDSKIVAMRSFVGGTPVDQQGHGTVVAGGGAAARGRTPPLSPR